MTHAFKKLKKKILLRVLSITLIGVVVWGIIQFVLLQSVQQAPNITEFGLNGDGSVILSTDQLNNILDAVNHRQSTYLLTIGLLVILLIAFYYIMIRLTRYFRETSSAVDKLLEPGTQPILMSPEMDFMQEKLNSVKQELTQREEEIKQAETRKNELVAYLAHDTRTPLTTVVGYLNLLKNDPNISAEKRASYLDITLASANRLEALIDQFFEITRYNLQKMPLEMQEFDLTILLEQLADGFYPMLQDTGKEIIIQAPKSLKIWGDTDKLSRVFRNILKNAISYSEERSTIRVTAEPLQKEILVTVSDIGDPIPGEELEAVFDKFYRLDAARRTKTGGAGLGLAIAKEIVLAHGGSISAGTQGNETTFYVKLPIRFQ